MGVGVSPVMSLNVSNCRASSRLSARMSSSLTAALRQAVADFTRAARSEDDRTGLVVKRG